jgi:hypothetical protein
MEINLNMSGVLMMNEVGREVDCADVVAVDQAGLWQGVVQLHEQLTKPARLRHAVGHNAILYLRARTWDNVLALREWGDEVVA